MLRETLVIDDAPSPTSASSQFYVSPSSCPPFNDVSPARRSHELPGRAPPRRSPGSALLNKLSAFVQLSDDEVDAVGSLSHCPKRFRSGQILIHEGSPSDWICLVISGLACRYKMLANGRRQILGYLIPGDACDFHFAITNNPDHSVAVIGEASVARIPVRRIAELIELYPNIGRAMTMASLGDSAVLREWLLNVGQRDAMQKLSHFFCEMAVRQEAVSGIDDDGSFELPINQMTLGDTLGLTPVHVNRTLQRLRTEGLIRLCHRRLSILDRDRLAAIGDFDGAYLNSQIVAA